MVLAVWSFELFGFVVDHKTLSKKTQQFSVFIPKKRWFLDSPNPGCSYGQRGAPGYRWLASDLFFKPSHTLLPCLPGPIA